MKLRDEPLNSLDVSDKHKKALGTFCTNLLSSEIDLHAIVIIGSASRAGEFNTYSDIDLCIYCDSAINDLQVLQPWIKNIEAINGTVLLTPGHVKDWQGERVEMFAKHSDVIFDITFISSSLPIPGETFYDIPRDFLEIFIANVYRDGVYIYGDLPNKEHISRLYFPFYNSDLRNKRLQVLECILNESIGKAEKSLSRRSKDIMEDVFWIQRIFLQWIFIYHQHYPASYEKRLDKQLSECGLPESQRDHIMCLVGNTIYEMTDNFLNTVKELLYHR